MAVSKVTLHIGHAVSVGDMTAVGSTFDLPVISERMLPDGTTEVGIFIADERMRKLLGHILLSSVSESERPVTAQTPPTAVINMDGKALARAIIQHVASEIRNNSGPRDM